MKRVLAVVAVSALLLNSYLVYDEYLAPGEEEWLSSDDDGDGTVLEDLTVTVPPPKMNDVATYDYLVFAEMYFKDYETGNWSLYQLTINGNLRHLYHASTEQARDGFWNKHEAVHFEMDTDASFEIFVDSHDAEPLYIEGSMDAERNEFTELKDEKIINTFTDGYVEIDRLPRVNRPLSYNGKMYTYPNPNREVVPTLEDQIYGEGTPVSLGDNGTVVLEKYYDLYEQSIRTPFNWSAQKAVRLKGYDSLKINITSEFFEGLLEFKEDIWITNDMPFPVKRFTRTNQTWEDEDGIFKIAINTTNTLVDDSYSAGESDIPWNPSSANWPDRNDEGEYSDWEYAPSSGNGISASSFDFGTDEADQYARENSPGLQAYLAEFDRPGRGVAIIDAVYNASKDPTDINHRAGSYRWNLTYGYSPTSSEWEQAREDEDWNFTYNIVVIKNVTRDTSQPFKTEYIETVEIEYDWGLRRGYSIFPKEMMPGSPLTLASSEDIMMEHPLVKEELEGRTGEIDWGDFDVNYAFSVAGLGMSGFAGPAVQLVELLTGISMPTADYAWAVQKESVYASGETMSAAVDAENGQLVYVTKISGTALLGMFG